MLGCGLKPKRVARKKKDRRIKMQNACRKKSQPLAGNKDEKTTECSVYYQSGCKDH